MMRVMRNSWLILALVFLVACQPAVVQHQNVAPPECNPPYHEYTKGDCCLDTDANGICDRNENQTKPAAANATAKPQAPEKNVMSDIIAKFRKNVNSYSFFKGDTQYFVNGDMVRVKLERLKKLDLTINSTIPVYITDIFVDRRAREAIGYCDPRRERDLMGNVEADRSVCLKIANIPIGLPYDEYNPYLPEDWLFRFSHAAPVLVEETDQYVKEPTGWKAVNPVLHYTENGDEVILRLESKTGLPIRIEMKKGERTEAVSYSWLVQNSVKPQEIAYQTFQPSLH